MNDGKYNYQFVLDEKAVRQGNSSHAKILQQVQPSSMVLECGPADGVMTRYLKETLGCTVYILELDPDSFANASRYADDGVCANLEEDNWMASLPDGSFDYILYADVLEHLRDPQAVLTKMRRFLKPEGCVLLSVPNIANGDVIANLLCDQFTYTDLGLLDITHIHFFARKNLREMIYASGYFLEYETGTRIPLFASEQGKFISEKQRPALKQSLFDHATYHIYQYICRLSQTETETYSDVEEPIDGQRTFVESLFYFDQGEGFSEDGRVNVCPEVLPDMHLRYIVEIPEGSTTIRFDPVEFRYCILKNIVTEIDGTPVSAQPLNGIIVGGSFFFPNKDPQVSIILPASGRILTLETELIQLGIDSWDESAKLIMELKNVLAQETEMLEAERIAHAKTSQALAVSETARCSLGIDRWDELPRMIEELKNALAQETMMLEAEQSAHAKTSQALAISETTRCSLNRARIRAEDHSTKRTLECETLRSDLSMLTAELENMRGSLSWRITKPLRGYRKDADIEGLVRK